MPEAEAEVKVEAEANVEVKPKSDSKSDSKSKTSWVVWVIIGVLVVGVILLFVYFSGKLGTESESMTKKKSKSDTVGNFDLSSAVRNLERMQTRILRQLTDDTGL